MFLKYLILFTVALIFNHPMNAEGYGKYYFDSREGLNDNPGTRKAPFKTISRLSELDLEPGDSIFFVGGSEFKGSCVIRSSGTDKNPIVITSFGSQRLPGFSNRDFNLNNGNVFQVKGSHIVIENLCFYDCDATIDGSSESLRKLGAIFIDHGAEHIIIRNCEAVNVPVAVKIYGENCLITGNYFHDTHYPPAEYWGPMAVMVSASNNEISHNRIINYWTWHKHWGADGGAIEIDEREPKNNIYIHHNYSRNNQGFLETAGGGPFSDVVIAYNVSVDYEKFIGVTNAQNWRVENNTVLRNHNRVDKLGMRIGYDDCMWFNPKETPNKRFNHIRFKNNIFVVANGIRVFDHGDGHLQETSNNLYYCSDSSVSHPAGKPLGKGDMVANPHFVDIEKGNFHLQPGSPAINSGVRLGYSKDIEGKSVPYPEVYYGREGSKPDIGAYEYYEIRKYENDHPDMEYSSPGFTLVTDSTASGGSVHMGSRKGSYMEFTFYGKQLELHGPGLPQAKTIDIIMDNRRVYPEVTWKRREEENSLIWSSEVMDLDYHNIKIIVKEGPILLDYIKVSDYRRKP